MGLTRKLRNTGDNMGEWYFWWCALPFPVSRLILETEVLSGVLPGAVAIQLQVEQSDFRAAHLPLAKSWWSAVSQTHLGPQSRLTPNLHPCTHRDVNPREAETEEHLSLDGRWYFCGRQYSWWLPWQSGSHRAQGKLQTFAKAGCSLYRKAASPWLLSALQLRKNKDALAVKVSGSFCYKRRCFMPGSFWTGT